MMLSKLMAKLAPAVFSQRPTAALLHTIRVPGWEGSTRFRNRFLGASLLSLIAACGLMLLTMGAGYGQLLPTVPVPGRPYVTMGPDGQLVSYPPRAVANRLILKLRPTVGPQQLAPLAAAGGGEVGTVLPGSGLMVVELPEGTDLQEAYAAYQAQPDVELVAYDRLYYYLLVPNDPEYINQYHHPLCNAPDGWDVTTGDPNVTIAIIDSGIDSDHPDLASKLWINAGEIPGNSIDDDANGYIDDVNGWSFVNNDNVIEAQPDTMDPVGVMHGTFVSSLAAAATNDGWGVAGVDWQARIMMCRVSHDEGYPVLSAILEAIDYAVDNGARAMNISIGGPYEPMYDAPIARAYQSGVLVVVAAGNGDWEFTDDPSTWASPVCNDGPNPYVDNYVLGVAATDENDLRAWFSNYDGSSANFVDVCAPGVDVYSAVFQDPAYPDLTDYWGSASGTSASSPITAGLAGLLLAENPSRTAADLVRKIREGAENIDLLNPAYAGKLGTGRINMADSLADIRPPEITILNPPNNSTTFRTEITILATISDSDSGVDEATIELEIDGGDIPSFDYDSGELTYDATLAAGLHEIIVRADDNESNEGEAVANFRIFEKSFDAGLHLFSLPYTYGPGQFPTPDSLFVLGPGDVAMHRWWPEDSSSNKYRTYPDNYGTFNPPDAMGGNPIVDSPPAGLGYFIHLPQQATVQEPGTILDDAVTSYEIDLTYGAVPPRGWNMIGSPFVGAVGWGSVQFVTDGEVQSIVEAVEDGVTDGILWEFVSTGSGGYYDFPANPLSGTLGPFKGYWVHIWEDTTLRLYAPSLGGAGVTSADSSGDFESDDGWQLQIIASAGGDVDPSNYIGVASSATNGYDPGLDVTEPPSVGSAVQCYQPRTDWDRYSGNYARDVRSTVAGSQTWDVEVSCQLSGVPVKLTWPELNSVVPGAVKLMLEDVDTGQQVYMRTTTGYSFTSPEGGGIRHLRITAYDDSVTSLTLTGVSAQAMSPSGGAVITYSLSKPATVAIEICNISGVIIKGLGERSSTGSQVEMVLWDGRSDRGTKVPAGRYLARITAWASDGQTVQAVRPFVILP